jgi:hypothetical protein
MSKQNKNGHKKPTDIEKVLLATAILELISKVVEIINKLLSG